MGYKWKGMRKMAWEEVQIKAETGEIVGCFYLYEDGTEAEIGADYTLEKLEDHYNCGGEFGEEL